MSPGFQTIVPMVTPYGDDGAVSTEAMAAHASVLAQDGMDGFFVCGTNGEGPLLSDDEVVAATRAVAGAAPGRRIIPQVGRPSTRASRELLERCVEAGATAVAVITPYFFKQTDDGEREHYRQMIHAADGIPVLAYVIPTYAGNDLSPDLVAELAAAGLAGLKDSTKSRERHQAYVAVREVAGSLSSRRLSGRTRCRSRRSGWVQRGCPSARKLQAEAVRRAGCRHDRGRQRAGGGASDPDHRDARGDSWHGIATLKRNVVGMLRERGVTYSDNGVRAPLR